MNHDEDSQKKQLFNAVFSLGFNFFAQGKYAHANVIFDGLMVLMPNEPVPFLAYGETLLFLEKPELAREHFLRTKERFVDNIQVVLGACKACVLLGKYDEASELLTPVLGGDIRATAGDIFAAQSMLLAIRERSAFALAKDIIEN